MKTKKSVSPQDIIRIAEELFFSGGYNSVSLNGISKRLGIRPASLYYHFKGGKEEIYLAVIRSRVEKFKSKIESIAFRSSDLEEILILFGKWFVEQSPMNMSLIAEFDMPHLSERGKRTAMTLIGNHVFEPIQVLFRRHADQLNSSFDPLQLVGSLSTLLTSIHTSAKMSGKSKESLVEYTVDLFLNGARNPKLNSRC